MTTKPLVDELRPAAVQLSPALKSLAVLAPQLKSLLVNDGPLTRASQAGIPALERFLDDSVPLLARATPYLGGVIPVLDYINTYRREVAGFFANSTAAAEATAPAAVGHKLLHYVRVSSPLNPETLTDYAHRLSTQPRQPVSGPGRLLQPRLRAPRVRQLSVHEQPSADDRPYYCARRWLRC